MMRPQSGFTLVEMLVAISVAMLLVSLVYGAVRVGQRSVSAMEVRVTESETMRVGWIFLRDALTRSRPVLNPDDDQDTTGFDGTANALRFVADMPAYIGLGGLTLLTLQVEDEADRSQLVLTRRRYDPTGTSPAEQAVGRAVLVDGIDDIRIEYFGLFEDDEALSWHAQWQGMSTLPTLVRIAVTPSTGTPWPPLIARPLQGDAVVGDLDDVEDETDEDDLVSDDHGDEVEADEH